MKSLLGVLITFLSLNASATSLMYAGYEANIVSMRLDPQHNLEQVNGGNVRIYNIEKVVKLTLNKRFSCPGGRICPQVMPQPEVIELPIIKDTFDICGVRTIVAEKNYMPVDGGLLQLTVRSYDNTVCVYKKAPTNSVIYKTAFYRRLPPQGLVQKKSIFKVSPFQHVLSFQD